MNLSADIQPLGWEHAANQPLGITRPVTIPSSGTCQYRHGEDCQRESRLGAGNQSLINEVFHTEVREPNIRFLAA